MPEDIIKSRELHSKDTGATYLYGRIWEYNLKSVAVFLVLYSSNPKWDIKLASKIFTTIGSTSGNWGNFFQALQGWEDLTLTRDFPTNYENTDKYEFAIIALARGSLNAIEDTIGTIAPWIDDSTLTSVGLGFGISTDILGFIKNLRDTQKYHILNNESPSEKNKSLRNAYAACLISRIPLIASAVSSLIYTNSNKKDYYFPPLIIGLVGYFLFNAGAILRQYFYHEEKSQTNNLFFSTAGRGAASIGPSEPIALPETNINIQEESSIGNSPNQPHIAY